MEIKTITYEGKPCQRCGKTTRYIKNRRCQHCTLERGFIRREGLSTAGFSQRSKVYVAHIGSDPSRIYEGKPCAVCGSPFRYKKCGKCVECRLKRAKRLRNRNKINEYGSV